MKNPIKMDDLGVPLFLETPIGFHCNFFFFPVVRCGEKSWCPHLSPAKKWEYTRSRIPVTNEGLGRA